VTEPPPSPASSQEKAAARFLELLDADEQFSAALPDPDVRAALNRPGIRLAECVRTAMEGYAPRPALAERSSELVTDAASGRRTTRLLPSYDTITYAQLWERTRAVAAEWHARGLASQQFVCALGVGSIDFAVVALACVHLGVTIVPLQTSASTATHVDIASETEPEILAVGVEFLQQGIDAVLAGVELERLIVLDYRPDDDDQRDRFEEAQHRLVAAGSALRLESLAAVVEHGRELPEAPLFVAADGEDPLALLVYTSGSTGTPKGAMLTEQLQVNSWQTEIPAPLISLSYMPMSHLIGYGYLMAALANGGTTYFAATSDLSTLLDDLSLVRPTMMQLVPRTCEVIYHHYLREVDRRVAKGADLEAAEEEVKAILRDQVIGGRVLNVACGSAALAPEIHAFIESMMDMHLMIGYSSTEIAGGLVLSDGKVQRPPVLDWKLIDVPELGYFTTDQPHPRGELLVKSDRFMAGYYKRPELTAERFDADGFYMTGDIMAQIGPEELVFVDRRNNVIKLSQGEFVAVSQLEALYAQSPVIQQIYVHGTSDRPFLVAVVVPTDELVAELDADGETAVRAAVSRSVQEIARSQQLATYEVPRDYLIEAEPFTQANGLLTGVGKHQRPALKAKYGERLEELYASIARDQIDEMRALRTSATDRPVLETVLHAARATLGISSADVRADVGFSDLGGDSLSALTFSQLLEDVFHVAVPVGAIVNPTADLGGLAAEIERIRADGDERPTAASVHGAGAREAHAADLALEKFFDVSSLSAAGVPDDVPHTVLLTGATGYLGRFLAFRWLQRLEETGGTLVCLARGRDAARARERIESALASDAALLDRFRTLADTHLEVVPSDLGAADLGLDPASWARLADSVDLVVHPAAHVNHVLPYGQLFTSNVVGTAELVKLALTGRPTRFNHVSTLGVNQVADHLIAEDSDIRVAVPVAHLNDDYANGYAVSKWAAEVLLREAHERFGLQVSVFRPGMVLAHSSFAGQLNVPDMLTRLLFSVVATGVAPATFYAEDGSAGRPAARYDGLTVDFLAEVIVRTGATADGFNTYNMSSPHEHNISLDDFVDWIIEAGYPIERIDAYSEWVKRFETAMLALPPEKRQESVYAVLDAYRSPQLASTGSLLAVDRFAEAVAAAELDMDTLSPDLIHKYVRDLQHLGLLEAPR
jgi:fatty acid CoA ligase FadD9